MKGFLVAVAFAVVLLPLAAIAEAKKSAGFAPTSIFASKTKIIAGDVITLFTVLYNSSDVGLAGDVVFTVDGHAVGTKHIALGAGETQTASTPWTARAGSHAASAHLENIAGASGSEATLIDEEADTVTLVVIEAPPPSPVAQSIASAVSAIQTGAAAGAPMIQQVAQATYNSLEYLRENAVHALAQQLSAPRARQNSGTETSASTTEKVLGAATSTDPEFAAGNTGKSRWFSSIWRFLLGVLLFVCQIKVLFYALLALVVFILFRLLMTFISERHGRR